MVIWWNPQIHSQRTQRANVSKSYFPDLLAAVCFTPEMQADLSRVFDDIFASPLAKEIIFAV